MTNYGFEVLLARYQQPGYYNDPDFIIPDWPWLTLNEKKSQFALWSSFSAPLIMSAYVPGLSDAEVEYLTNADIIAIDQDALALQATLVSQDGYFDVLTKPLSNGDRLLTVLNKGSKKNSTTISVERMGIASSSGSYTIKDLWTGRSTTLSKQTTITLPTHATGIYRISNVASMTPTGMLFNTATMGCMTASGSKVRFETCMASDSQVWQISSQGAVSPLSAPSMCLAQAGKRLMLASCKDSASMQWVYHVTGNLINSATGQCLQQKGSRGEVAKCGFEQDDQVFGLPSGVTVVRGNVV